MTTTVVSVPEVSCGGCQSAIDTAVSPTAGVRSVAVDLDAKTVTIDYDEHVSPERLRILIEDQGYDVVGTHEQTAGGVQQ